jgi:hypothetical protein
MLDEEPAQALVAVLVCRHQRREVVPLARIRIGAALEQELGELVARVRVARRGRAVKRPHPEVVPRGRVHLGTALDEQAGRLRMPEEACEAERLEPVGRPRIGERRILVEKLTQALGAADGRGLEDVELGMPLQQLIDPRLVPLVDSLQQLRQGVLGLRRSSAPPAPPPARAGGSGGSRA